MESPLQSRDINRLTSHEFLSNNRRGLELRNILWGAIGTSPLRFQTASPCSQPYIFITQLRRIWFLFSHNQRTLFQNENKLDQSKIKYEKTLKKSKEYSRKKHKTVKPKFCIKHNRLNTRNGSKKRSI